MQVNHIGIIRAEPNLSITKLDVIPAPNSSIKMLFLIVMCQYTVAIYIRHGTGCYQIVL